VTGRRNRKRAVLAQNLFRSDAVAQRLVRYAKIEPGERVYDLGAGTGRVTAALLGAGARVVAVEADPTLAARLAARFVGRDVRVINEDLTRVRFSAPYKVVANLPFNATAAALRKLLADGPAPETAPVVLQREAARRYAGTPRASAISLALQPWFDFEVATPFDRRDFVPAPSVEVAVLRVIRRQPPLLPETDRSSWGAFIRHAFARPAPEARRVFRSLLSNLQWRRLACDLAIAPGAWREELTLAQWLGLYRFASRCVPPYKRDRFR
jgi:23S rRNA (adenine-N6)-dimethyltransferase